MSDAFERLNAMIDPNQQTWDLSPNDVAAIREVLATCRRQGNMLNAILQHCMFASNGLTGKMYDDGYISACEHIKSIVEREVQS